MHLYSLVRQLLFCGDSTPTTVSCDDNMMYHLYEVQQIASRPFCLNCITRLGSSRAVLPCVILKYLSQYLMCIGTKPRLSYDVCFKRTYQRCPIHRSRTGNTIITTLSLLGVQLGHPPQEQVTHIYQFPFSMTVVFRWAVSPLLVALSFGCPLAYTAHINTLGTLFYSSIAETTRALV